MEDQCAMKGAASTNPESITLQSHNASTRARSYTKEEWDAQKESIRWHYCVKKKKLHEVVKWFKNEGFFATEKQFKDRIRQWGFDKKVKMHEMKAIIRKRRVRQQQGKESRFEVRGQPVDEAKINRSNARYGDHLEGSPVPETPREVYCYTPPREDIPPSPVTEVPELNLVEEPVILHAFLHQPSPKPSPRPSPPKLLTSFTTFELQEPDEYKQDYGHPAMEDFSPSPAYFQSYATQFDLGYLDNGNVYPQWSDFELGLDGQFASNDLLFESPSTNIEYHPPQAPSMLPQSSSHPVSGGNSVSHTYQPLSNQATPPTSLSSTGTPSEKSWHPNVMRKSSVVNSPVVRKRKWVADVHGSPIYRQFERKSDFVKHEDADSPTQLSCGLGSCQYQSGDKAAWLSHIKNQHALAFVNNVSDSQLSQGVSSNKTRRYRGDENDELCNKFLDLSLTRGPNDIQTIHSLEKLISLCKEQGDYRSAVLLARKAEEANIETLGKMSRASLGAACARIDALACQGQYTTAKTEAEVLLKRAQELFGPNDCVTVVASSLLSKILYALGSYRSAEAIAKLVFNTAVERLGAYHLETLTARAFWAVVLLSVNRAAEGESVLRQVLRRYRPADKMLFLDRKGDLAYACAVQRKFDESEIIEREVLAGQTLLLGIEHPNTLKTIVRLARTLRLQERFEEAEEMLTEVLELQEKVLGDDSRELIVTWEEIGRCLRLVEGREEEALEWLEKAGSPLL